MKEEQWSGQTRPMPVKKVKRHNAPWYSHNAWHPFSGSAQKVSLSTAEAELQMLCEGSLATKNVGMLVKEMTRPLMDFQER